MIHTSKLGLEKDQNVNDVFKVGDVVELKVISVEHEERCIILSLRSSGQIEEVDTGSEFIEDKSAPVTFGDLFREKMENK